MLELILGILLAAGAMYFVLLPILRPAIEAAGSQSAVDEGDDPDDDMSAQAVALRALKEIEFDRATGKLSDSDYESLKAKYTAEALAAMRGEPGAGSREQNRRPAPVSRLPASACPQHGPRPERDAQFCSECGRRLGSAPGYCVRCGTALETDARYCNRCGARVAA
ncbi:MAG TPA: zinc ribbon domain-containing protein [Gemmatimonadales bacterium]